VLVVFKVQHARLIFSGSPFEGFLEGSRLAAAWPKKDQKSV
jgi:hypothetical protein